MICGLGSGEFCQQVTHVGVGLKSVTTDCLQDAVDHCTRLGTSDGVAEQPVFSADCKRSDSVFSKVVVDFDAPIFEIVDDVFPLIRLYLMVKS